VLVLSAQLFDHLDDDPPSRFYVPDLFFIECANILWKYVHRFGYSSHAAQHDIAGLIKLPLRVISTAALVEDALTLPKNHDLPPAS
jgi:predicted nucleic acid-binding protein